jgi:hypothetical protein
VPVSVATDAVNSGPNTYLSGVGHAVVWTLYRLHPFADDETVKATVKVKICDQLYLILVDPCVGQRIELLVGTITIALGHLSTRT